MFLPVEHRSYTFSCHFFKGAPCPNELTINVYQNQRIKQFYKKITKKNLQNFFLQKFFLQKIFLQKKLQKMTFGQDKFCFLGCQLKLLQIEMSNFNGNEKIEKS